MKIVKNKKLLIITSLIIVIIGGFIVTGIVRGKQQSIVEANNLAKVEPTTTPTPTPSPTPQPTVEQLKPTVTPTATTTPKPTSAPVPQWPVTYSQAEASSITVVVNKKHKLPSTYAPGGIRGEASSALTQLFNDAATHGIGLKILSGYRSYATQSSTYNGYVARDGQALADTYSARPGHSEHQTGLAIDVGNGTCDLEICFGDTSAGKWIAANAQNYGFIIRYPNGKQAETGYQYEPWHLRFVGTDNAKAVAASGKTLDQYYNVEAGGY